MKYAKFVDGILYSAVDVFIPEEKKFFKPTEEQLLSYGYLPMLYTTPPEAQDGFVRSGKWVQTEDAIVLEWEVQKKEPTIYEIARAMVIQTADDNTALRMKSFYPQWAENTVYTVGYKVQYDGELWRCVQEHTSQADWTPDVAVSLFAKVLIPDEDIILEWEQPNSTNPYMTGDKVTHNGKTYVSTVDNNVWEPGVYGWEIVE